MNQIISIRNQYCPNTFCPLYEKILAGNVISHGRYMPRMKCKTCGRTWVTYRHEVHYGLRATRQKMNVALEMFATETSIRKIANAIDVSPTTVLRWKKKVQNNIF